MKIKKKNIWIIIGMFLLSLCVTYFIVRHVNRITRKNDITECVEHLHTGYRFFDDWNVAFCTCMTDCMIDDLGYSYKRKRTTFAFTKALNNCKKDCSEYTKNSWGPNDIIR